MHTLINVLIAAGVVGFLVVCYLAIRDYRDWMLTPEDQPPVVAEHPAFAQEWRKQKRKNVGLWAGVAVLLMLLVAGMLYLTDAQSPCVAVGG